MAKNKKKKAGRFQKKRSKQHLLLSQNSHQAPRIMLKECGAILEVFLRGITDRQSSKRLLDMLTERDKFHAEKHI